MKAATSISNRLWLTYLLIVLCVLIIAFTGIVVAFQKSPLLYRQVFYRISLVNSFLKERLIYVLDTDWAPFIRLFLDEVKIPDVRIAILDQESNLLFLSEGTKRDELPIINTPSVLSEQSKDRILTYRDLYRNNWFYQISRIDQNYFLLTAALRPDISISELFQDELMLPLFRAGFIALVISFALGWFIARWITKPLEKISISASEIAEGNYIKVPIEGPAEVQKMARVINEMVTKVQDSIQSQQDFIANVSHEFKTPLTSIQGFAQALFDEAVKHKDERKKAAKIILDESERLNHLVNDLLLLARFDAGTMPISKSMIDINQLISTYLEKFAIQAKQSKIRIISEIDAPLFIMADGEKIGQIFNNLLDNAIKFSKPNGEVRISTEKDTKWMLLTISDSGPGISDEDQKRIFERFYQIDKARRGGSKRGVGLGLSIAYQIAQAHGGDILVESKPDCGSTFMVKLPIEDGQKQN